MNLPTILALLGMLIFGIIAIYLSIKEEKLKKELSKREEIQKRRLYEISVLRMIQERIGYSLDVEQVIDTLTGSLKNLFSYSTVSSLILSEDRIVIKTTLEERVGSNFLSLVRKSMLASINNLANYTLPQRVDEIRSGLVADEINSSPLASFFHIPLIINGKIVGLISICSTHPGLYKEEDMTIMYQLTNAASNALSKLKNLIATEQQKLMAMLTSLSDGIVMIDSSYKLTFINQAAKNLLSISHLDSPTIFDVVNMLSREKDFAQKIKDALLQNKTIKEKEVGLVDKTAEVIITPVVSREEDLTDTTKAHVMGVTVLIHDITLEKGLNLMKEEFTNAVVHELRSPLTAVKAASEMMIEDDSLSTNSKKLATIIEEQSKRLLNDINSLLDVAKMEAGHFTIWPSPSDIVKITKDTIDLFTPEAEKKNVKITLQAEDVLPKAFIDTTRIGQVLNNLLSNSLKFTPSGGQIFIKIVSQYNPQLPKTPTNPGILVSVTDSGIGIPEEKQKKLFTRFVQIRDSLANSNEPKLEEGTGLGLFIAKGIVESHNGSIYVNSTQGKGTTIFFTIPVAKEEAKTLLNPKLQSVLEQYTPKVLN